MVLSDNSFSPVECGKKETKAFSSPSDYCSNPVDENEEFLATLSGQPRQKMVPVVDKSPLQRALNELQFATANSTISATDAILLACGMLIASNEQHLAEALECIQRHISASSHMAKAHHGTQLVPEVHQQPIKCQSYVASATPHAKEGGLKTTTQGKSGRVLPSSGTGQSHAATNQSGKGGGPPPSSSVAANHSGEGGGPPLSSSTGQSCAATYQSGEEGGGPPPSSSTGQSHAGNSHSGGGGGGGAQPPSNTGQSGSDHGSDDPPNGPPPPPGKGSRQPSDQLTCSAEEELDPFPHHREALVVQADVRQIKIGGRVPDDDGKFVFTPPKVIDPGGKSDLVRCPPSILAPQPCSNTSSSKASVHMPGAHPSPCDISTSDPSSHSGVICSAPIAEGGGSIRVLPSSSSHREGVCSPQPSSHSFSVVPSEDEFSPGEDAYLTETEPAVHSAGYASALVLTNSLHFPSQNQNLAFTNFSALGSSIIAAAGDEDLYWTESQEAVHGEGASSVLVLTTSPHLSFKDAVTTLPPSDQQEAMSEPLSPL